MLQTRWSAEAWAQVRVEFRKALALRSEIRRAALVRLEPRVKPTWCQPWRVRTPTPHDTQGEGDRPSIPRLCDADIRSGSASGLALLVHRRARKTLRSQVRRRCGQVGGAAVFHSEWLRGLSLGDAARRA